MKFTITCQAIDAVTNEGLDLDEDEVAELIEGAICDFGPFKTETPDGRCVTANLVSIEVAPKAAEEKS